MRYTFTLPSTKYSSYTFFAFLVFSLCFYKTSAQEFTVDGYYGFPINPGQPNYLAGTMGELRSSHFHAGIDIKTGGKTGLPILATAEGYIWRIKISPYGYGKALYMRHPNGTTSVYAHLDRLNPDLDKFITGLQYKKESYSVEIFPRSEDFVFRKGEVIGYSGNSGSSSGPHLHFEIRDVNQRALDPLRFDFPEIVDDMTPILKKIAFTTISGEARVNDMFGRYEFDVIKVNGKYTTRVPIELKGRIGIEIYAYDLMNGVWSKNGIPEIVCRVNGDTIYHHKKNSLSFAKQRNILAHYNYQAYKNGRPKFDKLYLDDGNTQDFYLTSNKGHVFSDSSQQIEIFLADSYHNISSFETKINHRKIVNRPDQWINKYEIHRDFMHFKTNPYSKIEVFLGQSKKEVVPYFSDRKSSYFIWDLRSGLPDSVNYAGKIINTNIQALIPSEQSKQIESNTADITFKKTTLFDTLYFSYSSNFDSAKGLELFSFDHADIALKSTAAIKFKPQIKYVDTLSSIYSIYKGRLSYQGGEWLENENAIMFNTRDLVSYTIATDKTSPKIIPIAANSKNLQFKITDDLSGVTNFRAELNGQFLLMEYDAKYHLITAKGRSENNTFQGAFTLIVSDAVGNKVEFKKTL